MITSMEFASINPHLNETNVIIVFKLTSFFLLLHKKHENLFLWQILISDQEANY